MSCIRDAVVVEQSPLEVGGESPTSLRKFPVGTYSLFSSKQVFQRHGVLTGLSLLIDQLPGVVCHFVAVHVSHSVHLCSMSSYCLLF